jgi:hypothetical protein
MKKVVCPSCGAELGELGYHLCRNASFAEPEKCEYCGKVVTDPRHVCKPMLPNLKYVCADCGRVAVREQFLCKPVLIE